MSTDTTAAQLAAARALIYGSAQHLPHVRRDRRKGSA